MAPFQLHEVVAVPSPVLYAHVPTRLGAIVAVVINVVPAVGAVVELGAVATGAVVEATQISDAPPEY
jgi:hypothetical protein